MSIRLSSASIRRWGAAFLLTSFTYSSFGPVHCSPAQSFSTWMLDLPDGPDEWLFPYSHGPEPSIVTITWAASVHRTFRWDIDTFSEQPSVRLDPAFLNSRLCVPVRISRKGVANWKTALWTVFPERSPRLDLRVPGGDGYKFQPFIDVSDQLHPALVPYWMNLAEFYRKNRRYAEALAIYERAFASLKSDRVIYYMASLYEDTGRLPEIEPALEDHLRELETISFEKLSFEIHRTLTRDDIYYWFPRTEEPKESKAERDYLKTQAERLARERQRALRDARRDTLMFLLKSYLSRNASEAASRTRAKLKVIDDEDRAEKKSE